VHQMLGLPSHSPSGPQRSPGVRPFQIRQGVEASPNLSRESLPRTFPIWLLTLPNRSRVSTFSPSPMAHEPEDGPYVVACHVVSFPYLSVTDSSPAFEVVVCSFLPISNLASWDANFSCLSGQWRRSSLDQSHTTPMLFGGE
jgi:hypothetical protein